MNAAQPPSYRHAVAEADWLTFVAPYVPRRDHPALCTVNRRFWGVFAPLIWRDPLRTVTDLGLDPAEDIEWYLDFVFDHAPGARLGTRLLVRILDFRLLTRNTCAFDVGNPDGSRSVEASIRRIPWLFPALRCVLADGHQEIDFNFLMQYVGTADPETETCIALDLLSIPGSPSPLAPASLDSSVLRNLIYLDVSNLPGSLRPLISRALRGGFPQLRVLKARGRSLDDRTAGRLFAAFGTQLWSLDLGDNLISDLALAELGSRCTGGPSLRRDWRFRVEGRVAPYRGRGRVPEVSESDEWGSFDVIEDSDPSFDGSHPERYHADPPPYATAGAAPVPQADASPPDSCHDGRGGRPRRDGVDHVKRKLTGGSAGFSPLPDPAEVLALDISRTAGRGTTHLHLSGNNITAQGLLRLIRCSPGQLECIDCESPAFRPAGPPAAAAAAASWLPGAWPTSTRLHGVLGGAHLFRPVVSPNLRVLRIHHSVVTQIPTLEVPGMSSLSRLHVAETAIRERADAAFPRRLVPDTNPRLESLTLTCIPRRSSGPLTSRIVEFIRLASQQERDIEDERRRLSSGGAGHARTAASLLRGLRHICLEFEPDPLAVDAVGEEGMGDFMEEQDFSFFPDEAVSRSRHNIATRSYPLPPPPSSAAPATPGCHPDASAVASTWFLPYACTLRGTPASVDVWIGSGEPSPAGPAVSRYVELARDPRLHRNAGPATPAQVRAGVPPGVLVFHAAWDAQVLDPAGPPPPLPSGGAGLRAGMKDVLGQIKRWRVEAKVLRDAAERTAGGPARPGVPHFWWGGRLEVVQKQAKLAYTDTGRLCPVGYRGATESSCRGYMG